jgi:hypothetical protein
MSDFSERATMLSDMAQQQRTQVAMVKEANYIIATASGDAQKTQLAGKMLRDPTGWAAVIYAHICSVDPQVPTADMDDTVLSSAVGNAITDLSATEVVTP